MNISQHYVFICQFITAACLFSVYSDPYKTPFGFGTSASSRCQFQQHSTYEFFVQTSISAAFSCYMYVEKDAKTDIRTKNSRV